MKTIKELEAELSAEFAMFDDAFDKYSYLVELSALLPPYPEELMTEDRLVKGCQSRVWLDAGTREGRFSFSGVSDTMIINGLLYILQQLLNGQSPEDVAGAELSFADDAGISGLLSDTRQKGLGYIISTLQKSAAQQENT